jgi:hypothetical protein
VARGADRRGRGGLPAGAEALLALAPDRFVAEREALAARLAERSDATGAALVRRLRRPVGLAWLLNRLAQTRRDELDALLAAGDRLRAGQRRAIAGEGPEALREAEEAVRGAARALRTEAHRAMEEEGRRPDPAALARLELLLRVVAGVTGEVREALRRGVLEREPEVAGGDLSGLGVVPGGVPARSSPAAARAREAPPAVEPDRARRLAAERVRAERQARRADRERAKARREASALERARATAERALAKAQAAADVARARLAEAEAHVAAARAALERLPGPR